MKITFVLPHAGLAGGIRVLAIYAERLKQRGHEVFVVSVPQRRLTWKQWLKALLLERTLKPLTPPSEGSHFDGLEVNHRILERERPVVDSDVPDADVVIATWWETAEWVAQLSPSKGSKAYFLQHYEIHDYLPKDRVKATWFLPMHKITIAQWLVDIAREIYGDATVSLVPNAVDTVQFTAPPRSRQSIPTVGMMYATEGRGLWKGCDVALKAVAIASQTIPNLKLRVFGPCDPSPEFPLPPNAEYIQRPTQEQIRDVYASCDAWLFASRTEGFGLPILEAMACRTPVIGTPVGAAPELLADDVGFLVSLEDPEAMAAAIVQVFQADEVEWQRRSQAAYTRASSYTWDDATQKFEAALQLAIERDQQGTLKQYEMIQKQVAS
ncbi:MAG: glycosyltransferase family 4 protein [Leptolyngbyaceae cyanobacterium]